MAGRPAIEKCPYGVVEPLLYLGLVNCTAVIYGRLAYEVVTNGRTTDILDLCIGVSLKVVTPAFNLTGGLVLLNGLVGVGYDESNYF
jgi:hypothetical protein